MTRIEDVLREFPPGQRHVRFSFDRSDDGYVARALLTLPTGHMVAQTDAPVPDAGAAVDQVVNKLAAEVRWHQRAVRDEPAAGDAGRRRRRDRDFSGAGPYLSAARRASDWDGFFDVLRPLLRQLRAHARRELVLAQLEGHIPPGELTVGDLLDEVLVRAWDRWDRRSENEPLDRWLVGLLHEALDEWGFRPPDAGSTRRQAPPPAGTLPGSVYQRVREDDPHAEQQDGAPGEANPDAPYAAENGWAVENNPYWPFVDSLTLDDVLPANDSPEPSAKLAADEERRLIFDALRGFPIDQRRAFILHGLEDWSVEEIAAAQNRAPEQVREDIEAARRALRERLKKSMH